jgi:hypothetical protein
MYCSQSGTSKQCTPAQLNAYIQANPGTSLANSIKCNATTSVATDTDCNPLAITVMQNAGRNAYSAGSLTTGTPAYGAYTIDGINQNPGNVVLIFSQATGQTCGTGTTSNGTGGSVSAAGACEGLWIVQSAAAWTRPQNYPSGFVFPQFCNFLVTIQEGATYQGHVFAARQLETSSITIDATNPFFTDRTLGPASPSVIGTVFASSTDSGASGNPAAIVIAASVGFPALSNVNDAVSFADTNGSIQDVGNPNTGTTGPPALVDASFNLYAGINGPGSSPGVTGTGCSLSAGGTNNSGAIIATGLDTCVLAFSGTFGVTPATPSGAAPYCTLTGVGTTNTTIPWLTALPTKTGFTSKTTAAGTYTYLCL